MSIPTPPDLARGRVSWTIGRSTGTTLPGARGTVLCEPTAVAVAYSTATVLPEPVEAEVVAGVMAPVDLLQNDPDIWNWRITPKLGVRWEPFHIDVDGPVDLATAAVVPGKGPIRAVKGEKGDTPTWEDLPGKPTTYPPSAHTHAVADVSGLADRLASVERSIGWRSIPLDVGTGGKLFLRRDGARVSLVLSGFRPAATGSSVLTNLPAGFRPRLTAPHVWADENGTPRPMYAFEYSPYRLEVRMLGAIGSYVHASGGWHTADPWPTTIPGTPA